MKKNVFVMGSTGSIGVQSLDVISKSNSHKVIGLSCYSNSELLANEENEKSIKNIKKLIVIKFLSIFLNIINERY